MSLGDTYDPEVIMKGAERYWQDVDADVKALEAENALAIDQVDPDQPDPFNVHREDKWGNVFFFIIVVVAMLIRMFGSTNMGFCSSNSTGNFL